MCNIQTDTYAVTNINSLFDYRIFSPLLTFFNFKICILISNYLICLPEDIGTIEASCCIVLHYIALHCSALHCTALQCIALHCNVVD